MGTIFSVALCWSTQPSTARDCPEALANRPKHEMFQAASPAFTAERGKPTRTKLRPGRVGPAGPQLASPELVQLVLLERPFKDAKVVDLDPEQLPTIGLVGRDGIQVEWSEI